MNCVPIVFSFNKNFLLHFLVALQSIVECREDDSLYEIFVFHNDLDSNDIQRIKNFCRCGYFKFKFSKIENDDLKILNIPDRFGEYSYYYRLLIPFLIPEKNKVLYSDVDVIFKKDPIHMLNFNIKDSPLGVIQFNQPKYFTQSVDFNNKYFASGNLIINIKEIKKYISNYREGISKISLTHKDNFIFHDQDILNLLFYDKVTYLPLNFCVTAKLYKGTYDIDFYKKDGRCYSNYDKKDILDAIENPYIIHYTGKKPDQMPIYDKTNTDWLHLCIKGQFLDLLFHNYLLFKSKNLIDYNALSIQKKAKLFIKSLFPKSFFKIFKRFL